MEDSVLPEAAKLFNEKLFFECHDLLEDAWAGERGDDKEFLHGLIQIAVGLYHVGAGNHQGAVNLLERGVTGLERFEPATHGLDVAALREKASECLRKSRLALEGEPPEWEERDVPRMELVR